MCRRNGNREKRKTRPKALQGESTSGSEYLVRGPSKLIRFSFAFLIYSQKEKAVEINVICELLLSSLSL